MKRQMNTQQEKLLVATLAGLIIVSAAAMFVVPVSAGPAGFGLHAQADSSTITIDRFVFN